MAHQPPPANTPPGFPQQYGQPQPFQPPKKKKKWPIILGAVVAFIIVIAIATSGGDKDEDTKAGDSGTSQSENGSSSDDSSEGAPLGSEARDGKFGFVVTNVAVGQTSIGDNQFMKKDAQGQFVLVTLDVTNTSDEPQTYFGQNQKLFDTQGREFSNDWEAEINVNEPGQLSAEINPGNKITVTVVFDIPKDAVPAYVELHDSAFSGGVEASLR